MNNKKSNKRKRNNSNAPNKRRKTSGSNLPTVTLTVKEVIDLVPIKYRRETLKRNTSDNARPHNDKFCIFHKGNKKGYLKVRIAAPKGKPGFKIERDGAQYKAQAWLHHIALSLRNDINEIYPILDEENVEVAHICHIKICVKRTHCYPINKKKHQIRDQTCHGFHLVHYPNIECDNTLTCRIKEHWFNPCIHEPQCVLGYPTEGVHY